MADFGGADQETFRAQVAAELAEAYPAGLKDPKARVDPEAMWGGRAFAGNTSDLQIQWMRKAAEHGWTAPTWPKQYGGAGMSAAEARILESEMNRGGYRSPLASFGIWMLGPVL